MGQIRESLNGHILLNKQQFMAWMNPPTILELPTTNSKRQQHREATKDEISQIFQKTIQNLAEQVCTGIVEDYGQEQMDNIINDFDNFDILVAVSPSYQDIKTFTRTPTVTQNKMDKVVGFIITELGECKGLPNAVCVKLICVIPNTIKGSLLLGAYFLGIKHSIYDKLGVLELARGYLNVSGFISYTKMGFNKDISLYNADPNMCFSDYRNLPMSVNLDLYTEGHIIGLATGDVAISRVNDETRIFDFYQNKIKTPIEFLACNNLLLKAELNFAQLIEDIQICKTDTDKDNCKLKPNELSILSHIDLNQDIVTQLNAIKDAILQQISSSKGGSHRRRKNTRKKYMNRRKQRRFTKHKKQSKKQSVKY